MIRTSFSSKTADRTAALKNWEYDIASVSVETCDRSEDPTGYRAVFHASGEGNSFSVGASFLTRREKQLVEAGFRAPMTHRAIEEIENRLGCSLNRGGVPHLPVRRPKTAA